MGATTEKARLPRFSLVLGIESCCEVDDLSCLEMLEKCRSPYLRKDIDMLEKIQRRATKLIPGLRDL